MTTLRKLPTHRPSSQATAARPPSDIGASDDGAQFEDGQVHGDHHAADQVPRTTMMIGSIRLDIASTASSTSCSKSRRPWKASNPAPRFLADGHHLVTMLGKD